MQAPRGRQSKIHGNIVNVAVDLGNTVTMLPCLQSQTGTVKINLKRKLQYKSSALSLNVRPSKRKCPLKPSKNEKCCHMIKNQKILHIS